MSVNTQTAQQTSGYSLYIPTINKKYSADYIVYLFWKCYIGNIDRIDFVPIVVKKEGEEPVEDLTFWQAFIYVRPGTKWGTFMTEEIDSRGSFRFYPHQLQNANPTQPGNPNEYWIVLKNKTPVPYAQTHLNIHQLVNNNSLLEAKVAEMEKEILNMKSKMEEMVQDVARLQYDNDTMSMQLTGAAGRRRSDSHSTTESEAESFVNSFENILRMAEEQEGIYRDENGLYEEHMRQQMYSCASYDDDNDGREREEDLDYDSDGEASPRGRIVKKDANNNTYYQYEMLDVDGYNNGDVAPRGEIQCIESDDEDKIELVDKEVCSECGFKGKLMAYGWRHADDNLCQDCVNLPGMEKYEC